ncbi:MAG: J domain-containing protein, partial [Acidobacteriota bacterium]|nr:J domain-containing protein [Acidobacteriota bacterium]
MAKQFHPDLFYKQSNATLFQRIQHAFTEFAQAYETLKTDTSREVYDYRMRKELAEMKTRTEDGSSPKDLKQKQAEHAAENFEQGFSLLMNGKGESAIPFLARA